MRAALRRTAEAVVVALFAAVLAIFTANIAGRFLGAPIVWADEAVVFLMAWCTFLAAAFVLEEREHVVFDLAYDALPAPGRRAMLAAGALAVAAILGAALPGILDYTLFLWRERTNVLEIRLDLAYACFPIFTAALVLARLRLLARLAGRDWRAAVAAQEGSGGA